jgi:acyl-homoserine-lactone acylase
MTRILPAVALLVAIPLCAGPASVNGDLSKQVTIYRDTYGVPHIYARTDAGVIFGMMYAQAEDNFWQIETDYIRATGRSAEVDGPSGLMHDVLVRAYEAPKIAADTYEHADPPFRNLCDAFADALNFYLENHPEVKPRLITHFEPWFILAIEYTGPWGPSITKEERERAFPVLKGTASTPELPPDPNEGSNMWAIAPTAAPRDMPCC